MKKKKKNLEYYIEQSIFASRWIVAPLYLGICLSLFLLLFIFLKEVIHAIYNIQNFVVEDLVFTLLEFIDLSLIANLVILVVFSGFENFVSRMDIKDHYDVPDWQGKIDFASLKLKLISSIIAIASIQLLEMLLGLKKIDERHIMWPIIIYGVLVLSGLSLSIMEYIAALTKKHKQ